MTTIRVPQALADAISKAEEEAKLAIMRQWVTEGCPAGVVLNNPEITIANQPADEPLAINPPESSDSSCANQEGV